MSETHLTEEWRAVAGFPGYEISLTGRVRTRRVRGSPNRLVAEWREIVPQTGPKGHRYVRLYSHSRAFPRYVHRLVLEAFVGPCPEGMEACHFPDRDPSNNRLDNLRWDTHAENMAHMEIHGTRQYGETCRHAKLTASDVTSIRQSVAAGLSKKEASRRFKVTPGMIYLICTRQRWRHIA